MVITVQQVLHPFLIICFIFGLDYYPRKPSKIGWTVILSILYSMTIWSVYAYVVYYVMSKTEKVVETTASIYAAVIHMINTILSIIMSHYHRKV